MGYVLLVDDDQNLRKTFCDILSVKGFSPLAFRSGIEALDRAREGEIDVALIDLRLEDISGLQVLNRMRDISPRTRCIMLTGHASQATAIEAINLGAYAYFQKPLEIDQVLLSISHAAQAYRVEEILRLSEERFRSLYENSTLGLYRTTPDGRILLANPTLLKMLGYASLEELSSRDLSRDGFEPDDQRIKFISKIEKKGEIIGWESGWKRRDGSSVYVRESARAIRGDNGRTLYYDGTVEDITERKQAEEIAREHEARFQAIVETTKEWIWRMDLEGHHVYSNPAVSAILGYSVEEIVGAEALDFIHPEDRTAIGDTLKESRSQKIGWTELVLRWRHKDGSYRFLESNAAPVFDAKGQLTGFQGTDRDITERKRAEENLRESTAKLARSQAIGRLGSWEWDVAGNSLEWSDEVYRIWGLGKDFELTFANIAQMIHPDDREINSRLVQEFLETRNKGGFEFRIVCPDGTMKNIHQTIEAVHDLSGQPLRMFGIMQDITERKAAEYALRMSEERYRMLAENMSDTVWLMDMNLKTLYASPSVFRLRGYSLDELNDLPLDRQMTPESFGRALQLVAEILTPDNLARPDLPMTYTIDLEFYRKDGSAFWSENTFVLIRDENGRPINILGTGRNITDRKNAEREIRRRVNDLEVLYENSLAVTSLMDPVAIGQRILETLNRKLDWHHAAIRLYNPARDRLEVLAFSYPNLSEADRAAQVEKMNRRVSKPGIGISGWVFQNGESVLCPDTRQDERYVGTFPGIRSGVYGTLKVGVRIIGTIAVESTQLGAFNEYDLRLLETVSAQASIAIENARLYQETVRAGERRAIVYRAGQEIASAGLDLGRIYQSIHQAAGELIHLDALSIVLADEAGRMLNAVYLYDRGRHYPPMSIPWGSGISGHVCRERKPLLIKDMRLEKTIRSIRFGRGPDLRSSLSVPLAVGGRIVGVLSVQQRQADIYTEEDQTLLTTLANYAGTAIENAHLYAQLNRRIKQLDALTGVSSALRTALSRQEMLPVILDQVVNLFDGEGAAIASRIPQTGETVIEFGQGKLDGFAGLRFPPEKIGLSHVIRTGKTYIAKNVKTDKHISFPKGKTPDLGTIAYTPLKIQKETIGALAVGRTAAFSGEDMDLLTAVADIAANAIRRAILYEESVHSSEQLVMVNEIGRSLAETLDPADIYKRLTEAVERLLPDVSAVLTCLYLPLEGRIDPVCGRIDGKPVDPDKLVSVPYQRSGKERLNRVIRSGKPLIGSALVNVDGIPRQIPQGESSVTPGSGLFVPMVAQGRVIGVLQVQSQVADRFGQPEQELMALLANTAAISIVNAWQYETIQAELVERKRIAEELMQSEEKYRLLSEELEQRVLERTAEIETTRQRLELATQAVELGIWEWDLATNELTWDERMLSIYGVKDKDFIDSMESFGSMVHPDDRPKLMGTIQAAQRGERPELIEYRIIRPDRSIRHIQAHGLTIDAPDGQLAKVIGTVLDITAQKQIEEELRHSEEIYRALFEKANDAIFLVQPDGALARVNPRASELLDYQPEDLIGRKVADFFDPVDTVEVEQAIRIMLSGRSMLPFEEAVRTRQGEKILTDINLSLILDENGQPKYIQSVVRDITARKKAEETLRLANAELERALRLKDEFLANMSHELRTPLNAILGISESLEEQVAGPLNQKQLKYIRTVSESGRHLLALINDILDLSKIEAGRMTMDIQPASLDAILQSSLHIVKELTQKKGLNISIQTDTRVEVVKVDDRRMKQVLVNLLSNAVKFTPQGGNVGVEIKGDEDAGQVEISVWDTGVGIPREGIPRLFQPFVQLDSGLDREHSGTGLGLALVAQIVRLHGGRVGVESEPGKGSRFFVILPWQPETGKAVAPYSETEPDPGNQPGARKNSRILLVEDTDSVVLFIRDYLEAAGYKVLVAMEGMSGVAIARQEKPDLILMDIQMPGVDGCEATAMIRKDPALESVPIIALTAMAMQGDRERCLAAGMNDYMSKPVSLKKLVGLIESHLKGTQGEQV
jgi:PAS domain S-box-containing protein